MLSDFESPPRKLARKSIFFDSPNIMFDQCLKSHGKSAIENVDFVIYSNLNNSVEVSRLKIINIQYIN